MKDLPEINQVKTENPTLKKILWAIIISLIIFIVFGWWWEHHQSLAYTHFLMGI